MAALWPRWKPPVISEEKGGGGAGREVAVNFGFSSFQENTLTLFGNEKGGKK